MHRVTLVLLSAGLLYAQAPEFTGPTILSRGAAANTRGGAAIAFRPYAGLSAVYDTFLTPVSITSEGKIPQASAVGVVGDLGLYGYKPFKRTIVGLDYRGSYRHYNHKTYYDGSDQFLDLTVMRQATRRIQLAFHETAGTYTRQFGYFTQAYAFDPSFAYLSDPFFDNRTIYLGSAGDVVYQRTMRLSFSAGGQGYLVRRRSSSLYGVTGYATHGDVSYRQSRYTTIGLNYQFSHFDFTKAFGASDLHTLMFSFARRLSRSWELSLMMGGSRVENLNLARVTIDPVIAAITGQTSAVRAFYKVNYLSSWQGKLSREFRHGRLSANYFRMVSPGNGIYLTSRNDFGGLEFSYTGIRKWNIGWQAAYNKITALTQDIGAYEGYVAGLGITRSLAHSLHLVFRVDGRRYETTSGFRRSGYRASLGFNFSPGDIPLRLW